MRRQLGTACGPSRGNRSSDPADPWQRKLITMSTTEITRDRIIATDQLIRPHIRRTPVVEASGADFGLPPVQLVFKLEFLQHSGSFKTRGAFSNLLSRAVPPAGVVAASGGNHGGAVAFAAVVVRKPATIFVPTVCSPEKIELIRDCAAGGSAADALAPKRVGDLMFPIAERHVEGVLLVPDSAIQEAQEALWRVLRVVVEPGGAAALAALLSRCYVTKPGERVGILLCGGNTAAVDFRKPSANQAGNTDFSPVERAVNSQLK